MCPDAAAVGVVVVEAWYVEVGGVDTIAEEVDAVRVSETVGIRCPEKFPPPIRADPPWVLSGFACGYPGMVGGACGKGVAKVGLGAAEALGRMPQRVKLRCPDPDVRPVMVSPAAPPATTSPAAPPPITGLGTLGCELLAASSMD